VLGRITTYVKKDKLELRRITTTNVPMDKLVLGRITT
jgi:hypothetical protein